MRNDHYVIAGLTRNLTLHRGLRIECAMTTLVMQPLTFNRLPLTKQINLTNKQL
jgi:hypothetical protein